jgi:aminopeptidase N
LNIPLNIFLGAAIIRMMNDFLGEATFREGVKNYLNEKYSKDLKKKTSRAE